MGTNFHKGARCFGGSKATMQDLESGGHGGFDGGGGGIEKRENKKVWVLWWYIMRSSVSNKVIIKVVMDGCDI